MRLVLAQTPPVIMQRMLCRTIQRRMNKTQRPQAGCGPMIPTPLAKCGTYGHPSASQVSGSTRDQDLYLPSSVPTCQPTLPVFSPKPTIPSRTNDGSCSSANLGKKR
jgi:hypothetical protein